MWSYQLNGCESVPDKYLSLVYASSVYLLYQNSPRLIASIKNN